MLGESGRRGAWGEDWRSGDSWLDAGVEEKISRTKGVWPSLHDLDYGLLSTMLSWNVVLTMVGVSPNISARGGQCSVGADWARGLFRGTLRSIRWDADKGDCKKLHFL